MGGIWLLHGFQVLTCRLSFCTLMAGLLFSATEVSKEGFHVNNPISKDDATPIVVVIPGLASDSSSAHIAFKMAKRGWNVVVSNHRGQGGISVTSDCFYNAGWTGDVRSVIDYLHREYPQAPLFVVGTSIGANILACAIFYDKALTMGLQGYAELHVLFGTLTTMLHVLLQNLRCCSSASYLGNVSVPLLCISALDDPVCTREAIPWDECRANRNIVLATTQHGGHLGFFQGLTGDILWWVSAVDEFLCVLHGSSFMHRQNKTHCSSLHPVLESSIDQGPYLNVMEDGMVAAMGDDQAIITEEDEQQMTHEMNNKHIVPNMKQSEHETEAKTDSMHDTTQPSRQDTECNQDDKYPHDISFL